MKPYEIEDLIFRYPGRFRMHVGRFHVEEGETVAVVGENGSGKTTFLRLLAFLERPQSFARFLYWGEPVVAGRTRRGDLGFVRQKPWIFSGTVGDNLAFPLRARGFSRRRAALRIEATAERLGLARWMDAPARSLSGGQQKRLALGRVLAWEPRVLLLDEPTAHLDAASRRIVQDILAGTRSTVVMTTHDPAFALGLSGRTLRLAGGRIGPGPAGAGPEEDGRGEAGQRDVVLSLVPRRERR